MYHIYDDDPYLEFGGNSSPTQQYLDPNLLTSPLGGNSSPTQQYLDPNLLTSSLGGNNSPTQQYLDPNLLTSSLGGNNSPTQQYLYPNLPTSSFGGNSSANSSPTRQQRDLDVEFRQLNMNSSQTPLVSNLEFTMQAKKDPFKWIRTETKKAVFTAHFDLFADGYTIYSTLKDQFLLYSLNIDGSLYQIQTFDPKSNVTISPISSNPPIVNLTYECKEKTGEGRSCITMNAVDILKAIKRKENSYLPWAAEVFFLQSELKTVVIMKITLPFLNEWSSVIISFTMAGKTIKQTFTKSQSHTLVPIGVKRRRPDNYAPKQIVIGNFRYFDRERQLTDQQKEEVFEMFVSSFRKTMLEHKNLYPANLDPRWLRTQLAEIIDQVNGLLAYDHNEQVRGIVVWEEPRNNIVYVNQVAVHPEWWSQMIGTTLMREMHERVVLKHGRYVTFVGYCRKANSRAINFYQSLGVDINDPSIAHFHPSYAEQPSVYVPLSYSNF